jgi:hypothetical protein
MIANLRKEHFKLGEQTSPMVRASAAIGTGAVSPARPVKAPWAHMKTSYTLGTDNVAKATDYQNRFAHTTTGFHNGGSPHDDCKKNKAKMNGDSVIIAANNHFDSTVTSKMTYRDTLSSSRKVNTGLDAMTTSYITGSHFKVGYGGFGGQTENTRAFNVPAQSGRNGLSPERIQFFKEAHFNHQDPK